MSVISLPIKLRIAIDGISHFEQGFKNGVQSSFVTNSNHNFSYAPSLRHKTLPHSPRNIKQQPHNNVLFNNVLGDVLFISTGESGCSGSVGFLENSLRLSGTFSLKTFLGHQLFSMTRQPRLQL
eukprot:TRINITY_DN26207_c0_g1_i1.p1 TRINITY_DN26207_c0_g1~~TRINITY_DN26207_c0_g1_i1.p1  ORF type:complete len:124 (+),score=10.15 TRINITY_DN26207_c0_g1_i1:730-1101(+)